MAITAAPISSAANWKGAQTFTAEATKEVERLWSESPDVKKQSELNSKRSRADTIKAVFGQHLEFALALWLN